MSTSPSEDERTETHHERKARRRREALRLIVAKIDADPSLMRIGVENLKRWRAKNLELTPYEEQWEAWLAAGESWERLRTHLLDESEAGEYLHQAHPFIGLITDDERAEIYGYDLEALKRNYERHTGRPWPTTIEMMEEQFPRNI